MDAFDFSRVDLEGDLTLLVGTFVLLFVVDTLFAKCGWFSDDHNVKHL